MSGVNARRGRRGFTLVEVMVTLPLVALMMLGAFDLYLMSLRLGSKTGAQLVATQDAANAIQQVVEITREANAVVLAGSGALPAGVQSAGYTSGQFSTTMNGQAVYTGLYVTMPAALQPADVAGYAGAGLTHITLKGHQGGPLPATQAAALPAPPYTIIPSASEAATQVGLLIYRADGDGTPNPSSGGYLWERAVPAGTSGTNMPLCRTIAAGSPNAVQFVQPAATNQIEVKIVSGVYSAINGVQTDEEGNGTYSSQLDGKCALMRDHDPSGTSSGSTGIYNPFQAH